MAQAAESGVRNKRNGLARDALKARANDVLDDFSTLRKDVSKLAQAANKAAHSEATHAGKKLRSMSRDLRDRAAERVDSLSDHVRERPGAAVGVSLGLGLLLGMFLSARR